MWRSLTALGTSLVVSPQAMATAVFCAPGTDDDAPLSGGHVMQNGNALVECVWDAGCEVVSGFSGVVDVAFVLDPVTSTFDLHGRDWDGNRYLFQDDAPYVVFDAPCPFTNDRTGVSSIGTRP